METFKNTENTKIFNSYYGWQGETKVKVNDKCWMINTMKHSSGVISTHCHVVEDKGDGNYSYMMFGRPESENFQINILPKGTKATEKNIREAHYKALAEFDAKQENNELPQAKKEYQIEVGQIIFTDGLSKSNRRVIYDIEKTNYGTHYKTVLLDGSATKIDDMIRPFSKKFGIGVYYNEDERISQEEINDLLISAHENMKQEAAKIEAQEIINKAQAEAKREYLSQFTQADRKTTTNILKRHILSNFKTVSKVEVKTDSFAGGDSMDVTYYAPEKIEELRTFIESFQHGHFNSMEDIYEYSHNEEIILEGHILRTYKYVFTHYVEAEAPQEPEQEEVKTGAVQIIDYSEKSFAIIGDTKPIKDKLKELGGKFNFRLTCGAGWIFPKAKAYTVRRALNLI